MRSLILAAGQGTRLRPYTNLVPKCLVEVDGATLISRQIDVLRSEGIDDITVVAGYLAEKIKSLDLNVIVNHDYEYTNMLHSLFSDTFWVGQEVIISYGDIVYSRQILRDVLASESPIAIPVDKLWRDYWSLRFADPLSDAESLLYDEDSNIASIGQVPTSLLDIQAQYMGIVKLTSTGSRSFLNAYNKLLIDGELAGRPLPVAYMTDFLQYLISAGDVLKAVPVSGDWVEVDSVEDLLNPITTARLRSIRNSIDIA